MATIIITQEDYDKIIENKKHICISDIIDYYKKVNNLEKININSIIFKNIKSKENIWVYLRKENSKIDSICMYSCAIKEIEIDKINRVELTNSKIDTLFLDEIKSILITSSKFSSLSIFGSIFHMSLHKKSTIETLFMSSCLYNIYNGDNSDLNKIKVENSYVIEDKNIKYKEAYSSFADVNGNALQYNIGETIEIKDFEKNRWIECAPGIHFFITEEEARNYKL